MLAVGAYPPQQMGVSDHALLANVLYGQHHIHGARYVGAWQVAHGQGRASMAFGLSGRVWLSLLNIYHRCTLDRLWEKVGGVSVPANIRTGLYPDVGGVPDAGTLIVETAATISPGMYRTFLIAIADTVIDPGKYWLAAQANNAAETCTIYVDPNQLFSRTYDQVFGAFTTPCPATAATSNVALLGARVKSYP